MDIMIYDWESLVRLPLYRKILDDWCALLNNNQLKEGAYHDFLAANPAIFLMGRNAYLAISKLKLGSEYETDFVVVTEGYSDGTMYELIEIESPHTVLFDKSGKPTAKFNAALQQIRDWRRFLMHNKSILHRMLPTINTRIVSDSRFRFKIIIGRRTDDLEVLEKRRQISEEVNIEIISFDRLTEIAHNRSFFWNYSDIFSAEMDRLDPEKKNELANPFAQCISDSQWKGFWKKKSFHFYPRMIDEILRSRTYNSFFDEFRKQSQLVGMG